MNNSAARISFSHGLLPTVLSVIAGSADVASLLGLGLFSAHVTGNLVILTAQLVAPKRDDACLILSVPVFILVSEYAEAIIDFVNLLDVSTNRLMVEAVTRMNQ